MSGDRPIDPQEIAERQHKLKEARIQRAYKKILATPEGKDVFRDVLDICGVYSVGASKVEQAFFNEGRRSVGAHLIGRVIQADPYGYADIVKKAAEESKSGRGRK